MNFTTPIKLIPSAWKISHHQPIMLMGSCFAKNMVEKLSDDGFHVLGNPFGVQYNPLSINKSILRVLAGRRYLTEELFLHNGLWHCWDFDSFVSCPKVEDTLVKIDERFDTARVCLSKIQMLLITWGTSRCYLYQNEVVNNCHKVPAKEFVEYDLSVSEIVEDTANMLAVLFTHNPHMQVVITVSPIRYLKYGLHESQLSKAALLLAANELQKQFPRVEYFPAYEILMDELRDYRFYAEDMVHPSDVAVQYVYDCFTKCYMDDGVRTVAEECRKLKRSMNHRPLHADSPEYRLFKTQLNEKINLFRQKYPYLNI